jgi:3-oxoadipate enol-lactonase
LSEFVVHADGVALAGEESGEGAGVPVVLLHGLTATRRYVLMGSRALERAGNRVISYDARGHGRSAPASDRDYGYPRLALDLRAVLDARGVERAVLAGVSMGAHTAVRLALQAPERVAALALVTPAYEPSLLDEQGSLARWDELAHGLREQGVDGFVRANHIETLPQEWHAIVDAALRQRMSGHKRLDAVADALEAVPRSRPFDDIAQLATISVPTVIIASRDEADPLHPLAVGERYAQTIPGARLLVEDAGPPPRSPLAWQGGQISKAIESLLAATRM